METDWLRFSKGAMKMRVGLGEGRTQRAAAKAVGNSPELPSFSFQEQFLPERSQEVEGWPHLSQYK